MGITVRTGDGGAASATLGATDTGESCVGSMATAGTVGSIVAVASGGLVGGGVGLASSGAVKSITIGVAVGGGGVPVGNGV